MYCTYCNYKVQDNDIYCENCGKKILHQSISSKTTFPKLTSFINMTVLKLLIAGALLGAFFGYLLNSKYYEGCNRYGASWQCREFGSGMTTAIIIGLVIAFVASWFVPKNKP